MIGYGWSKVRETISGWEKSHFGGFHRMISDYPFIKLDYEIKIKTPDSLNKALGWWTAEKLIKLYLLKVQSIKMIDRLTSTVEEQIDFTGKPVKKIVTRLDERDVMRWVMEEYPELAPLFEHYQKDIFATTLEKEVKDDQKGEGEGEGEGKNDEEQEGEGEGQGEDDEESEGQGETEGGTPQKLSEMQQRMIQQMQKSLDEIKEQKPFTRDGIGNFDAKPVFKSLDTKRYSSDYVFTHSEMRDAENLVKLLDISFDPKSDVVKSLRAGKLDVCKIAEVPAGSTAIYKQVVEDQDTKPFTVCILADLSGSMTNGDGYTSRIDMQKHVLNSLYLAMSSILPADKLWIYGHTGDDAPEIYPFHTPYSTDYARNIRAYDNISYQQNYDGPVIEAIHQKIREVNDDRVIFIMLSDGQPSGDGYGSMDDIVDMKRILEKCKRDEFVTVGIGIQYHSVEGLYVYSKVVENLKNLVRDISHVINNVVRAEFK
jgi:hypothetical protein